MCREFYLTVYSFGKKSEHDHNNIGLVTDFAACKANLDILRLIFVSLTANNSLIITEHDLPILIMRLQIPHHLQILILVAKIAHIVRVLNKDLLIKVKP